MTALPPPDDDLAAFYDAERVAPTLMDVEAQARILDRVRIVADIAAPATAATATAIGVKTLVAVAALSFAAGGVVGHVATRDAGPERIAALDSGAESETEAEAEPAEAEAETEAEAEVEAEAEAEAQAEAEAEAEADVVTAPAELLPAQDLSRERRLLDSATAAIARENWAEADAALARHGRVFPRGALVEEREALRVRVAYEDGRDQAAIQLAQRFLARFSGSLYSQRVSRLLQRARERAHAGPRMQ